MKQRYTLTAVLLALLASSCISHQELVNFTAGPEFPQTPMALDSFPVLKIQPDDLLTVRVKTLDAVTAAPFNLDQLDGGNNFITTGGPGNNQPMVGYLVDSEGMIDFPVLGRIKVAGFTTQEAKDAITRRLQPFLRDPVVIVRFINFRVTVMGEVNQPNAYTMPNERVTILDALGLAGDLTNYADRKDILVIRENDGQRVFGHLNLQDRDLFNSPFFYLRQNDVVYIRPLPAKTGAVSDQTARVLPWISVVTSLVTLGIAVIGL